MHHIDVNLKRCMVEAFKKYGNHGVQLTDEDCVKAIKYWFALLETFGDDGKRSKAIFRHRAIAAWVSSFAKDSSIYSDVNVNKGWWVAIVPNHLTRETVRYWLRQMEYFRGLNYSELVTKGKKLKGIQADLLILDDPDTTTPATGNTKELTGGSVNYYQCPVEFPTTKGRAPYTAECNDLIEALKLTPAEANIFKAVWRTAAARQGKEKIGNTAIYDYEKIVFFAQRNLDVLRHEASKNSPA